MNFLLIGRRVLPAYDPMIHLSHLVSHFCKSKVFALYSALRRKCLLLEGMAYFVPLLHLVAGTSIRGRVRQEKGILGSMAGDFLTVLFCPFCAIVQEAQELRGDPLIGMAREWPLTGHVIWIQLQRTYKCAICMKKNERERERERERLHWIYTMKSMPTCSGICLCCPDVHVFKRVYAFSWVL